MGFADHYPLAVVETGYRPAFSERFDRAAAGVPNGPEPWLLMERIG